MILVLLTYFKNAEQTLKLRTQSHSAHPSYPDRTH